MSDESKGLTVRADVGGFVGVLWYIGWLFTIACGSLIWWQALLAIIIGRYYLGVAAR
jgi:hypothetical protein